MTTPKDTVPLDAAGFARAVLLEALKRHVECEMQEELVLLPSLSLALMCSLGARQDLFASHKATPIDIVIGSFHEEFQPTRFSLAGLGQSTTASIQNGISRWVDAAGPMLKAVFDETAGDLPGLTVSELRYDDPANPAASSCWRMFLGQPIVDAVGEDAGAAASVTGQLDRQPLMTLLGPSLGALNQVDPQVEHVWLKVFLSRMPGEAATGECLLNDTDLDGGLDALREFAWPDLPASFASVRQYAIFKRIAC